MKYFELSILKSGWAQILNFDFWAFYMNEIFAQKKS